MQNKKMIDPHMHLWDLSKNHYPWLSTDIEQGHLGDYASIRKHYLLSDYLAESQRYAFEKAVHIQAGIAREYSLLETAWLQDISTASRFPLAVIGYVDLSQENCPHWIEQHRAYPCFKGIRQILSHDPDPYYSGSSIDYLRLPAWKKNIRLLAQYGLTFDMQIYPEQIDHALPIIDNTETVFVVEHFCMPKEHGNDYRLFWLNQLKKLAKRENVYLKLSGFGLFKHTWTSDEMKPFVFSALDAFGVDRCMFASNFPVEKLYQSLDKIYDTFMTITDGFTDTEKYRLFYGNADEVYFK